MIQPLCCISAHVSACVCVDWGGDGGGWEGVGVLENVREGLIS